MMPERIFVNVVMKNVMAHVTVLDQVIVPSVNMSATVHIVSVNVHYRNMLRMGNVCHVMRIVYPAVLDR